MKQSFFARSWLCIAAAMALLVAPASANMGLPIIAFTTRSMILGFVPIVAIETWVLVKRLGWNWKDAASVAIIANLVSTVVAMPLVWFLGVWTQIPLGFDMWREPQSALDALQMAARNFAWHPPENPDGPTARGLGPVSAVFLLVPMFFGSWASETLVARWLQRSFAPKEIRRAVFMANLASYVGLFAYALWRVWKS